MRWECACFAGTVQASRTASGGDPPAGEAAPVAAAAAASASGSAAASGVAPALTPGARLRALLEAAPEPPPLRRGVSRTLARRLLAGEPVQVVRGLRTPSRSPPEARRRPGGPDPPVPPQNPPSPLSRRRQSREHIQRRRQAHDDQRRLRSTSPAMEEQRPAERVRATRRSTTPPWRVRPFTAFRRPPSESSGQSRSESPRLAPPPLAGSGATDDAVISAALEKLRPILRLARFDEDRVGRMVRLPGTRTVRFDVHGMRPAEPVAGSDGVVYVGFHGCGPTAMRGILADGFLRARRPAEGGWDVLFFQAAMNPPYGRRLELLDRVWRSSFGRAGLCIQARYEGLPHIDVPGGGHSAESAQSQLGRVTRYTPSVRWTMPPRHLLVESVFVNLLLGLADDWDYECRAALALA